MSRLNKVIDIIKLTMQPERLAGLSDIESIDSVWLKLAPADYLAIKKKKKRKKKVFGL